MTCADRAGRRLGKPRLVDGLDGVARLHEMLGEHADDPAQVVLTAETDRGLLVVAMVSAGYTVLAINPMSTARYRERQWMSGAKSDAGDAFVLAEVARTDRHLHRPVAGDSDLVESIKIVARAHQNLVWTRHARSTISGPPCASTTRPPCSWATFTAPTPSASSPSPRLPDLGRTLSVAKIASTIRRAGRQRRVEERARDIQAVLRADQIQAPRAVADAMGVAARAMVSVVAALGEQIAGLEGELADRFDQHPDTKIVRSLPGLGTILGTRVLASSGTTRTAMSMPSLARTTPPRHPSPEPRASRGSCSPATPATSGSPTPSTCGPSHLSPPAPAPGSSATKDEPAATPTTGALQALANRFVGILPRLPHPRHPLRRAPQLRPVVQVVLGHAHRRQGVRRDHLHQEPEPPARGRFADRFFAEIVAQAKLCRYVSAEDARSTASCEGLGRSTSRSSRKTSRRPVRQICFRCQARTSRPTSTARSGPTRRTNRPPTGSAVVPQEPGHAGADVGFTGHFLVENRNALIVDAELTQSTGYIERDAAVEMLGRLPKMKRCRSVAADKGLRHQGLRGQGPRSGVHAPRRPAQQRTTLRHRRLHDAASRAQDQQSKRPRVEEPFGWTKTIGGGRKLRYKGRARNSAWFKMTVADYNVLRTTALDAATT